MEGWLEKFKGRWAFVEYFNLEQRSSSMQSMAIWRSLLKSICGIDGTCVVVNDIMLVGNRISVD